MSQETSHPPTEAGRTVERGETYTHEEHGAIEVAGIWSGTHPAASASIRTHGRAVAIRYVLEDEYGRAEEFSDTLEDFLTSIS